MSGINLLSLDLKSLTDPEKAVTYGRFFKTGPGQYGAGDKFLGLDVPTQRKLVKKYLDLSLGEIHTLLQGQYHEQRVIGLAVLIRQFAKAAVRDRKIYFDFYLAHTDRINNWDLVDISAPHIVGQYLLDKDRSLLYQLAKSASLWERRIAIISTFAFIRNNEFKDTLAISTMLLSDKHDLIHKAMGWMLREVGKRNQNTLTDYLDLNYRDMPRTALRYSIEKFPPALRAYYLKLR